jgi:hypothetical protein
MFVQLSPFMLNTYEEIKVSQFLSKFLLSIVAAVCVINPAVADEKVNKAMSALKSELAAKGKPRLEGDQLFFGSQKINGDFTVVDSIKAKHGGTATIFVKEGNNYIRRSTNVMKAGQRAVGTPLDPSGPAKAAIDSGKPFYGPVDILGKIFQTGYEPIVNESGATIGIYYVGYSLE